jgi:endo-1,4-beta-D-glucanase Y
MRTWLQNPWTVEERPACYIVKDANGFAVAYVYYEEEPGRRAAANLMTQDEARRIVVNIAKLPGLLTGGAKAHKSSRMSVANYLANSGLFK